MLKLFSKVLKFIGKRWCCQTGLNCRPLHYQWSALPLSYGSMPGMGESAQMAAHSAAGSCHKGPSGASTRAGREGSKIVKNRRDYRDPRGNSAALALLWFPILP